MRKLFFALLILPQLCFAQGPPTNSNPLGGNLTVQDAGTCSTMGSFLWQHLPSNAATTTVNLVGTFSGTLTIRLSNNGGGSWTTNNTTTSAGTTSISTNGFTDICADVTTFTSGSFAVTISTGLNTGPVGPAGPAGSGGSTSTTTSAWKDGGGIIIPFVATDSETMEESTWLYEASCQILTTLSKCWKVWHSAGWNTTGMSYAECPSLTNGAPGVCTRLNNGALFTSTGSGSSGARSRGYVLHQGATYYMFICGASCNTIDMWSSSTGKDDFVLVQAAVLTRGVSGWDAQVIFNPIVWVEGTTWKIIYTGLGSSVYGLGFASCTSVCTGGAATFTKDGGNPFITADAVNLGGYGNADMHIVNGNYWIWAHSSATTPSLLPSDIFRWNCGAAGNANKPTGCVQTPSGIPSFGRQTTDEGAGTIVGQVADALIVERTDLGKTFLFYEGDLDGTQQGGMEHLKYSVAEMSLAALISTSEGRQPIRDNVSLNSLAIAAHTPPGLGMLSVGNSNSSVAFKANNPTCNVIYMANNATVDLGGLYCNSYLLPGTPSSYNTINAALTAYRLQFQPANANANAGIILGQKNIAGVESFPLQALLNAAGSSFDILPPVQTQGTLPTCSSTGSTGPSCGFSTGSTDTAGIITITVGTAPATSGTVTLTFSASYGTNIPACIMMPSQLQAGQWNPRATIFDKTPTLTSDIQNWDNNGVALTASTAIDINYHCWAK